MDFHQNGYRESNNMNIPDVCDLSDGSIPDQGGGVEILMVLSRPKTLSIELNLLTHNGTGLVYRRQNHSQMNLIIFIPHFLFSRKHELKHQFT